MAEDIYDIIYIDDEGQLTTMFESFLGMLYEGKYTIRTYNDPRTCQTDIQTGKVAASLWLIDVMMDGIDGVELAYQIRQQFGETPLIFAFTALQPETLSSSYAKSTAFSGVFNKIQPLDAVIRELTQRLEFERFKMGQLQPSQPVVRVPTFQDLSEGEQQSDAAPESEPQQPTPEMEMPAPAQEPEPSPTLPVPEPEAAAPIPMQEPEAFAAPEPEPEPVQEPEIIAPVPKSEELATEPPEIPFEPPTAADITAPVQEPEPSAPVEEPEPGIKPEMPAPVQELEPPAPEPVSVPPAREPKPGIPAVTPKPQQDDEREISPVKSAAPQATFPSVDYGSPSDVTRPRVSPKPRVIHPAPDPVVYRLAITVQDLIAESGRVSLQGVAPSPLAAKLVQPSNIASAPAYVDKAQGWEVPIPGSPDYKSALHQPVSTPPAMAADADREPEDASEEAEADGKGRLSSVNLRSIIIVMLFVLLIAGIGYLSYLLLLRYNLLPGG